MLTVSVRNCACVQECMHVRMHACMFVCMSVYVSVCVCVCVCVCTYVRTYVCTQLGIMRNNTNVAGNVIYVDTPSNKNGKERASRKRGRGTNRVMETRRQ